MSDMKNFGDAELNAYLDAESQSVVLAWLAESPEAAAWLEAMSRNNDLFADLNQNICR